MSSNDNIKAGLFVLAGIIIALVVTFLLSDFSAWFEGTQKVKVYFQLSDGVKGLNEGSEVTLGGQSIGSVTAIDDVKSGDGSDRIVGKVVTIVVPDWIKLAWDAELHIVQPPIGKGATLNINNTGRAVPYVPDQKVDAGSLRERNLPDSLIAEIVADAPTGAIPGDIADSALVEDAVEQLGIDDFHRAEIQRIIRNVASMTDSLEKKKTEIESIITRANNVLEDVESLTSQFPPHAEKIADDITATTGNLRSATADMSEILAKAKEKREAWFKQIDRVLTSVDEATSTANAFLKRNDPSLQKIVDHAKSTFAKIDEITIEEVNKTLKLAREGVISFNEAADRVNGILASQTPVIERTLASLQLTADQLKLASIEVRRSPWRLLYEPSDKELETDNLYDAARSFALAAGALQSAAGSLESVSKARPDDEALIKVKLEELNRLFEKYKETEATFWKRLKEAE